MRRKFPFNFSSHFFKWEIQSISTSQTKEIKAYLPLFLLYKSNHNIREILRNNIKDIYPKYRKPHSYHGKQSRGYCTFCNEVYNMVDIHKCQYNILGKNLLLGSLRYICTTLEVRFPLLLQSRPRKPTKQ